MLHLAWPLRPWVTSGRWNAGICLGAFIRPVHHVSSALLPSSQDKWNSELQICHVQYQQKLEVIAKRLKEQLKLQKWPKLTQLEFGERCFQLPIRFEDVEPAFTAETIMEADVRYLAGFFDGDGCVSVQTDLSGCSLQLAQTVANSWILFHYLVKFGGSICVNAQGCGSTAHSIAWRACGGTARHASSILQQHCIVKEGQLKIASSWPKCREDRDMCRARLAELKKCNQFRACSDKTSLSWSYVSGFFDAEGCIVVDQAYRSLRLAIAQRDPEILQLLQVFLLRCLPPQQQKINLYSKPLGHVLVSCGTATSIEILTNLLEHGLQVKRSEALHALNVPTSSHSESRRNVRKGKGKQSFFTRLDEAGSSRARTISKITKRISWMESAQKEGAAIDKLRAELAVARLQHQVLNAKTQIQKLRCFIASIQRAVASNCWKSLTSL